MADGKNRAKRSQTAARKARAKSPKNAKRAHKKARIKEPAAEQVRVTKLLVNKAATRKPVPIKKARVRKSAILPPLPPPPTVIVKATRAPLRRASRVKALLRNKGAVKSGPAAGETALCSEAALREKLRLAAPYLQLWLSRRYSGAPDAPTPEAAFVRIWQWMTMGTMLEDRRVVTADLVGALFAEEADALS